MEYLLHQLFLDRIAKGQLITTAAIKLAAQKYHDAVVAPAAGENRRCLGYLPVSDGTRTLMPIASFSVQCDDVGKSPLLPGVMLVHRVS